MFDNIEAARNAAKWCNAAGCDVIIWRAFKDVSLSKDKFLLSLTPTKVDVAQGGIIQNNKEQEISADR